MTPTVQETRDVSVNQTPPASSTVRRSVTSSNGRSVRATMPSDDLEVGAAAPRAGCSRRRRDPSSAQRSWCGRRSPPASCSRTIRSPEPSSATLTASTSTPRAGHASRPAAAPSLRPTVDDPQRQVEALGLGDHVGEARPVREQRERHVVATAGRRRGRGTSRAASEPGSTRTRRPVEQRRGRSDRC